MKKIIFSLALLAGVSVIHAQTSKNDWMLGGGLQLSTAKSNTAFVLQPNAALFVADNLAIGANLGIGFSKIATTKNTDILIGPMARYYFTTETQMVRPFAHVGVNFLSSSTKFTGTPSSEAKSSGLNYLLAGGAAFFINENVSIDALLGYDHTKLKNIEGSGGLNFSVGFQIFINKATVDRLKSSAK